MNARVTRNLNQQLAGLEMLALLAQEVDEAQEYERDFDPPEDDELPEDL